MPYLGMFTDLGVLDTYRTLVPYAPILLITISYPLVKIEEFLVAHLKWRPCDRCVPLHSAIKALIINGSLVSLLMAYVYINYWYLLAWAILTVNLSDIVALGSLAISSLLWVALTVYDARGQDRALKCGSNVSSRRELPS